MRTIAFVTQKGGAGKTTLAASLAVAAAGAGERVIALDFDPQGSWARWGQRRGSANPPNKILVEQFEAARLPRLQAILQRIADTGFTLAIFDTPGADSEAVRVVAEAADICLLPALCAAAEQDNERIAILGKIYAVARPPVDDTFLRYRRTI